MEVSPLRDKIGRTVLGLFGAAGVLLGAVGAVGVHATGPRLIATISGLALIGHSVGLLRTARHGRVPSVHNSDRDS